MGGAASAGLFEGVGRFSAVFLTPKLDPGMIGDGCEVVEFEETQAVAIDELEASIAIDNVDAIGTAFENGPAQFFAGPQGFFTLFAFSDIAEKNGDLTLFRGSKRERVDIIPAFEGGGALLETNRLAGQSDLAIDIEPVLFVSGREVAHELSGGILYAGVGFEGGVSLEETIVVGLLIFVEKDLDNTKAGVNGI